MKSKWVRVGLGFGAALVLASGCSPTQPVETLPIVELPAPVEPVEPPAVVEEPSDTEEDPYRPDLGRPGFETPDIIMRCGDHQMSADFFDGGLNLALDGGDYVLLLVDSEDGRMYTDGDITLWNLDTDWGFFREGEAEEYECFLAAIS